MTEQLFLSDSEKFVIYSSRYFDSFFLELSYEPSIQIKGPYVIINYYSKSLKQNIEIIYDFLRSDRIYYQIEVNVIKKVLFGVKKARIEPIEYFENIAEPTTIESNLSLLKELLCQYLIPLIRGEKWVDEL